MNLRLVQHLWGKGKGNRTFLSVVLKKGCELDLWRASFAPNLPGFDVAWTRAANGERKQWDASPDARYTIYIEPGRLDTTTPATLNSNTCCFWGEK
ncbi:hypothetical protein [Falsiruegeria mediterranea]